MSKTIYCPATNEDGLSCIKPLFNPSEGEYWDHAGGHFFTSQEGHRILKNEHVDAGALLAGLPVSHHKPEDCTKTGFCSWRD